MADDLMKPDVCVMGDDVAAAIADWGRKSIAAKEALEIVVGHMEALFRDRAHMVRHKMEIKYYLRASLSNEKLEVLRLTDSFMKSKGQTPEQKELMGLRAKISRELNKMYLEILNATFPPDEDVVMPPTPSSVKSVSSKNDSVSGKGGDNDDNTVTTAGVSSEITTGLSLEAAFSKASTSEDVKSPAEAETDLVKKEQPTRRRFKTVTETVNPDLFETSGELLSLLGEVVGTIRENKWVVLEPCCGNDAIVNYLQGYGIPVIARDKFTKSESHDVLKDPMPDGVDMVITNPPFNLKFEIIARLVEYGKPFILLLPLETMSTKTFHKIVGETKFDVIVPIGRSRFLHAGKTRDVGPTAWYLFSPYGSNSMTFKHLGDKDDVELGSKDSDEGSDYDDDERSQELREQAILDDPRTEFMPEGYVKDGF